MSGIYHEAAHDNIAPATAGSWQSVDLSALGPSAGDAVIVRFVATVDTDRHVGIQPGGAAHDVTGLLNGLSQALGIAKVASDGTVEIFIADIDVTVTLEAWIDGAAIHWIQDETTDAEELTLGTNSQFNSYTRTPEAGDVSQAFFFELISTNVTFRFGWQYQGSLDDLEDRGNGYNSGIGNATDIGEFEVYHVDPTAQTVRLKGYIKSGYTRIQDGVDDDSGNDARADTPITTGSYQDLTALPAEAFAGVWWGGMTGSDAPVSAHVRRNGDLFDGTNRVDQIAWFTAAGDTSRIAEGFVADTNVELYLLGTFDADTGTTLTVADTSQTITADSPSLTQANTLAVNGTVSAQTVDGIALVQANTLAVDGTLQSITVDPIQLVIPDVLLAVNDSLQSVTVGSIDIKEGLGALSDLRALPSGPDMQVVLISEA